MSTDTILTIIMGVIMSVISALFGIVLYQSRKRIDGIEKKADSALDEVQQVKDNYIKRFDEVKETINCTEKNIIKEIHNTQLHAANTFLKKEDCPLIHQNKLAGVVS